VYLKREAAIFYLIVLKHGAAMLCNIFSLFLSHICHAVLLSKLERKLISVWLMRLLVCNYRDGADVAGCVPSFVGANMR
jgi:hypothetical protein